MYAPVYSVRAHLLNSTCHGLLSVAICTHSGLWFNRPARRLFNLTRIPKHDCDMLNAVPREKDGRHIHVMLNDWCYTIQVYDGAGRNIGVKELEHRLWEVVQDVQRREAQGERATRIGILTSDERTQWAKVCSFDSCLIEML
jgi:hypothetical protein